MSLNDFFKKWKQLNNYLNDKGIPVWTARDPSTLEGSVSLTLVVISSFLIIIGIVGKASGLIGGIDMSSAFNFFYASTTLYFGHSWVHKDDTKSDAVPQQPAKSTSKVDDPDV